MRAVPTARSFSALLFLTLSPLWAPVQAQAKLLQIIHTNDLHAAFETHENGRGGYAQVKAVMDSLKQRAAEQGIDTLTLDGGDFTDGTIYRYAQHGTAPYRIMDAMGYDATAIGNHDWLVASDELNELVGEVNPSTPYLAANLEIKPEHGNLLRHIKPYLEFQKAGAKIAVVGLTTNSLLYEWRIVHGKILSAKKIAKEYVAQLRQTNDFVIILSHLGVKGDQKLVQKVSDIDLVVGAHSHTLLAEPLYKEDPDGKQVPIVQAGAHGEYVGDLLVDIEPGKPLKIVHYVLRAVKTDGPKDPVIDQMIKDARAQLDQQYGYGYLDEVIGYTDVPMERAQRGPTTWASIYAETIRQAAHADAALDAHPFYGPTQAAGPVTREKLFNFYPRTFDVKNPFGWTIWSIHAPGWVLKAAIEIAYKAGTYVSTAGVEYTIQWEGKKPHFKNWRIGGRKLHDFKEYRVGVTEGIGRGGKDITSILKLATFPKDTGIPVWTAVEQYVRSMPNSGRAISSVPSQSVSAPEAAALY